MVREYRRVQLHNLLLMESVCRGDQLRSMPEILRAVKQHPGDGQPDEQGDIDGLAEPAACPLVFNRVQQLDELVLFEMPKPVGADAHRC